MNEQLVFEFAKPKNHGLAKKSKEETVCSKCIYFLEHKQSNKKSTRVGQCESTEKRKEMQMPFYLPVFASWDWTDSQDGCCKHFQRNYEEVRSIKI